MKVSPAARRMANEIFQMAVLEPKPAIFDETDSGLDIDARIVADGVNAMWQPRAWHPGRYSLSASLELHRPRRGSCARRWTHCSFGWQGTVLELEARGYGWIEKDARQARTV